MERSVKERLTEFIKSQNISVREFERRADLSNGYLKSLRKSPTIDKMRSIISAYPMLNQEWLLTGEGNMLVESIESNAEPLTNERRVGVRLVSQYAYAGYLSGYGDDEYLDSLPLIDFTPDREMTGNWLAFEVRGDSMDDGSKESYIEGEIVICREVEPDYWRDSRLFINKRDFVIVHKEGILIKRIIAHDVDKHTITIHSLNPLYKDRTINLKDVLQIYSIIESRIQRRR
jgi:phage repressor protein C with HTH and peptisase S24 domain